MAGRVASAEPTLKPMDRRTTSHNYRLAPVIYICNQGACAGSMMDATMATDDEVLFANNSASPRGLPRPGQHGAGPPWAATPVVLCFHTGRPVAVERQPGHRSPPSTITVKPQPKHLQKCS